MNIDALIKIMTPTDDEKITFNEQRTVIDIELLDYRLNTNTRSFRYTDSEYRREKIKIFQFLN